MRIISKFKDYYDGLQDHSSDLVYVRLSKELEPNDVVSRALGLKLPISGAWEWRHARRLGQDQADNVAKEWHGQIVPTFYTPELSSRHLGSTYRQYEGVALLFCGKLYRGIRYRERWKNSSTIPECIEKIYWDRESFEKDHAPPPPGKSKYAETEQEIAKKSDQHLEWVFDNLVDNKMMDLHFLTRCPVIGMTYTYEHNNRHGDWVAVLNPSLKEHQFIRVMDPTIMFQELSMFLGGVLSNNDRPEKVDDKYKIIAHGFDLKESFRKGPTKEHR